MTLPDHPVQASLDSKPAAGPAPGPWPLHPVLVAAYPALALLAHNRHEAKLVWAAAPLLLSVVAAAGLWGLLAIALRDLRKSALAASLAALFFFSFGHVISALERVAEAPLGGYYEVILLAEFGLLLLAVALLHRMNRPPVLATRFANVASAVLVALPLLSLAWFELAAWQTSAAVRRASALAAKQSETAVGSSARPDVYLIVPDAHARSDVMMDLYGHDMEPFLADLERLGFVIARRSTSNYCLTPKSLASMLNCRYLEEYDKLPPHSFRPYAELIRDSAFIKALEEAGYKTVAFPTGESYSEMDHFDAFRKSRTEASMFHRLYAELTPLAPILARSEYWNDYVTRGDQMLGILADLPDVAADPAPTFTFVHIAMPHPPFRFDENGQDVFERYYNLIDNGKGGRREIDQPRYREAYRGQAIFTDRLLLEAIRRILRKSSEPPLILLLSDHGPRLNMDWDHPEETDVQEALGNLTAVYFPGGKGAPSVYPTITPVNLFRVVLNEVFGASLPLLPDRGFLSVNHEGWYRLVEVTDRLPGGASAATQPSSIGPEGRDPVTDG